MKKRNVISLLLAAVLCMSLLVLPAFAENVREDGLELTLTADKTEYTAAESIIAAVQVKNTSGASLENLRLSAKAPAGYTALGAADKELAVLNSGAADSLTVTFVPQGPAQTGSSIGAVIIAAVTAAACLVLLGFDRKGIALVLAAVTVLGIAAVGMPTAAFAAENALEASTTVKVDGRDVTLHASVTWNTSAPTEPAPTEPAPTEPAPTDPAPTEPAPTEPVPTEPAPTEPAPTDPAPTEPAPTEPAPTEPAPTEPAAPVELLILKAVDNTATLTVRSNGSYKVEGNYLGFIAYSYESTYTVSAGVMMPTDPGPTVSTLFGDLPIYPKIEATDGGHKLCINSENTDGPLVLAEFVVTDAMMAAISGGEVYVPEPEDDPTPSGDLTLTSVCGTATVVIRKDGTYKVEGNYLTFIPYSYESTYTVSGGVLVPTDPGPTVSTLFGDLPSYPKIVADGDGWKLVINSENSDGPLVLAEFVISADQMAALANG